MINLKQTLLKWFRRVIPQGKPAGWVWALAALLVVSAGAGIYVWNQNQLDPKINQLIKELKNLQDKERGDKLVEIGSAYRINGDYPEAKSYYQQALAEYEANNATVEIANTKILIEHTDQYLNAEQEIETEFGERDESGYIENKPDYVPPPEVPLQ